MKRAAFKVQPERGGWLRTTLLPLNHRDDSSFRFVDVVMFFALVGLTVAIARVVLAH